MRQFLSIFVFLAFFLNPSYSSANAHDCGPILDQFVADQQLELSVDRDTTLKCYPVLTALLDVYRIYKGLENSGADISHSEQEAAAPLLDRLGLYHRFFTLKSSQQALFNLVEKKYQRAQNQSPLQLALIKVELELARQRLITE